jgi:hypothetical protein
MVLHLEEEETQISKYREKTFIFQGAPLDDVSIFVTVNS